MIKPSFTTMFSLSKKLTMRFDKELACNIIPLVFFVLISKLMEKILDYFHQEILFGNSPTTSRLFFLHKDSETLVFDRKRKFVWENRIDLGPFIRSLSKIEITKCSIIWSEITLIEFRTILKAWYSEDTQEIRCFSLF